LLLVASWDPASAGEPTTVRAADEGVAPSTSIPRLDGPSTLDSRLQAVDVAARSGFAAGVRAANAQELRLSGGLARVVVTADGGLAPARAAVLAVGGRVDGEYADLVQAYVPISRLEDLANQPAVTWVRPPATPVAAAVTDEGVAETNAPSWHADGFTGAGVKVGIIDLGFIGYPTAQAGGDLPVSVTTQDFGCGGVQTFTNHGTAVASIVHKMAPDAQLYLICIASDVDLGLATTYAIGQGITIVNHSVVWINTARGDGSGAAGTPDAIVTTARAAGILWVNGAGNHAQVHWSGTFTSTDDLNHTFAPGNVFNQIHLAAGESTCLFLKWDAWPTTFLDFDLGLFSFEIQDFVAASVNNQFQGPLEPTEALCYQNNSFGQNFGIVIQKFDAATSPRMDLFVDDPQHPLQFQTAAGSILEPGSSPNAMAAGAICWQTDGLEFFSSRGPNIAGVVKPDIAGQDAASSPVYGAASGCNAGFLGTSAAAPHVAGAAALVKEANPGFNPAQLQSFLEGRALDLGGVGEDNSFGWGRLWLGTAIPEPATGATYEPLDPFRILDTRFGTGLANPFMKGVPRTFDVAGQGGVPEGAVAVTGNLTATGMTAAGFVFLGPNPMANPPSSTLNFPVGDNRANGVTVALSATGTLSATFNGPAPGNSTHLIFDVTGFFLPDDTGATFFPLTPTRLLDTRNGTGGLAGPFVKGVPQTFEVTGLGDVPAEATAVTGNLTATGMTAAGFVFLGPEEQQSPTSSTLNFPLGDNRANGVTVALSDDGTLSATFDGAAAGKSTHLIFDVTGYFVPDDSGASFVPLTPARLLDSRIGNGLAGPFVKGTPRTFQVTGRGGVPGNATAVTGNLTATGMNAAGFAFLGPDPLPNPPSSTLNFPVGDSRANGLTVRLGTGGTLSGTFNGAPAGKSTHLIFDVTGYFR
jgi:hypothetical protein